MAAAALPWLLLLPIAQWGIAAWLPAFLCHASHYSALLQYRLPLPDPVCRSSPLFLAAIPAASVTVLVTVLIVAPISKATSPVKNAAFCVRCMPELCLQPHLLHAGTHS
jgi:hypothetical protein